MTEAEGEGEGRGGGRGGRHWFKEGGRDGRDITAAKGEGGFADCLSRWLVN